MSASFRARFPRQCRLLILILLLLAGTEAFAKDDLDLEGWLKAPGTRLLVVEFYSVHCAPCMKAVPKWRELYERYHSRGYRFLVVSTDVGTCARPDWTPDDVICDYDGSLQKLWNVKELPQAFLWSWEGRCLVAGGDVDAVEGAVENYYRHAPRILVETPVDARGKALPGAAGLKTLIRSEMSRASKFDLVADKEEAKRLREIRKQGFDVSKDEKTVCELGKEVSPNSILRTVLVVTPRGKELVMELLSVEDSCVTHSVSTPVLGNDIEAAIPHAVTKLTLALSPKSVDPAIGGSGGNSGTKLQPEALGEMEEAWELPDDKKALVSFESSPAGATVLMDGKPLCQATPCSKSVPLGRHLFEMYLEEHLPVKKRENVGKRTNTLSYKLSPDFGTLSVTSEPPGLDVLVDGKKAGQTPLTQVRVKPGLHSVLVTDPRYFDKGERRKVKRGEDVSLHYKLAPREGGLEITAVDERGNELRGAEVFVDWKPVGNTPFRSKVIVGSHALQVKYNGITWSELVEVREKQVVARSANMDLARREAELAQQESEEKARRQNQERLEKERKAQERAEVQNAMRSRTGWFLDVGSAFYFPSGGFGYEWLTIGVRYDWRFFSVKPVGAYLSMLFYEYNDEYDNVENETFFDMPMALYLMALELHFGRSGPLEFLVGVRPIVGFYIGDDGISYSDYEYIDDSVYSTAGAGGYFGANIEGGVRFNVRTRRGSLTTHSVTLTGLFDNLMGAAMGIRYELGLRLSR